MSRRSLFRPCIDLHEGRVKQIVGGTLDSTQEHLQTNFVSDRASSWYAALYEKDDLKGGHVIQLGPGNTSAAKEALTAYPGGLQIGGGVTTDNAIDWLEAGASHVIVTSFLFDSNARFQLSRLEKMCERVGKDRLVIDLSCRRKGDTWIVAMNRWQTATDLHVNTDTLAALSSYCDEFLIHAADVEGKCSGIDSDLVRLLGSWGQCPVTYAGGAASLDDLMLVDDLSHGKVDLTIGSALDIFGGSGVLYSDLVRWNQTPRGAS